MSRPNKTAPELSALGVPTERGTIYEVALTHRSYAFEHGGGIEHNERLEFLGDSILGAAVTELIYTRYPELSEGEMARLRSAVVSTQALAELARELGVGPHIRLGKGEDASGGADKASLLADTFEALIGALFLDAGMDAVRAFIDRTFGERLDAVVSGGGGHDPKNVLQETVVRARGDLPVYRSIATGPEHERRFTAEVYVGDDLLGAGHGRSKKEAEQNAARQALTRVEEEGLEAIEGGADARAS